ncbi:MAG: hypothetical protein ABIJ00_11460 [Candidatus Eisenbacteria bacterium]
MKRFTVCLSVICIMIGLVLTASTAGSASTIDIKVSPSTIALGSVGEWVTVHTDIALGLVDTSTLSLNDVPVAWTKADAKGNLVAKFDLEEIKAIIEPPEATLTLLGSTKDGVEFTGTDTVGVR